MMCLCNFFFLTLRKLGVCDKTFSQNVSFYAFEIISYKSSFPKDGTRETKDNQDVSKATFTVTWRWALRERVNYNERLYGRRRLPLCHSQRRWRMLWLSCLDWVDLTGKILVRVYLNERAKVVIQLFRERLSEKVHAAIPKGIVGGFEFAVPQRNLKEWHKRQCTYVCAC